MKDFDDQEAIEYILANVPAETAARYDDVAIQYLIDTLFEYYEDAGLLDIDSIDDDEEAELNQTISAMTGILLKDTNFKFCEKDLPLLIKAEAAYEQSLL